MKNVLKKAAALLLVTALLCLSLAGCYSTNKTWAAKKGDDTLPIGAYIYYLNSAYSEASGKVSSEEDVLKAQIDGKSAEAWIREKALAYVNSYYYISDKFNSLGLSLSEDDLAIAQSNTDTMWTYYRSVLEELGIAKESFNQAYSLYGSKYQQVMAAVYGAGGEKEVSEDELKTYFVDNYYIYESFYASLTKNDEDGNSVDMTDEEKEETKSVLDGMVKKISAGEMTLEEAAGQYAEEHLGSAENSTYYSGSASLKENISTTVKNALDEIEENQATLAETTSGYYVIRKLSIEEAFENQVHGDNHDHETEEEDHRASLITSMKSEEFADFVLEQKPDGIELNQSAMNSIKLSKLVNDNNKKGTSSASEDEE